VTGVVQIVTALERGGAQRATLELAARLHDPGRPQILVTGAPTGGPSLDAEAQRRLGARLLRVRDLVVPVRIARDAACAVELTRVFDHLVDRLRAPLVVHTHSSKAGVIGRLAARSLRGVLTVHTVHGFGFEALGPKRRWLLEAAERVSDACDVVIFVSHADRDRAQELGLYRGARQRVIRSGIEHTTFGIVQHDSDRRARLRAELRIANAPLAVTVANLKPQKDPLFHVEVLAAWRARDPQAQLLFLGDGPLRAQVEARARALGLEGALHLPGFVDDTRDALAAADVFLLASAWEGLPRAVLEATAAGLPSVVRDSGFGGDLSWAKRLRLLPLTATPQAFAEALVAQVASARTIAQATRVRQAKLPREFTLKGMLADVRALYDELIGPPRPTDMPARRRRR
jgi:glycosyltransferase involved in cell wall biosynthesis